jgi:hypothetical protein
MVYPPRDQLSSTAVRQLPSRERWLIWAGALLVAAVIAVTAFSLASSDGRSSDGCLNFSYSMVMGGEQFHACGQRAREVCDTPPKLGGLAGGLLEKLPSECRKAGLPYRSSPS